MLVVCGILFFILLLIGAPIFMAMIIACLVALPMNFPGMDMGLAIQRIVGGIDTFFAFVHSVFYVCSGYYV